VTTGIINGEIVEITDPEISGLVITMGNHLLEDGSDITLPKTEPPPDANAGSKAIPVPVAEPNIKSGDSR